MARKPDITVVAPFPPPYGGMGVRFEQLTSILEKRGYRCRRVRLEWVEQRGIPGKLARLGAFCRAAWQARAQNADILLTVTGSFGNFFGVSLIVLVARLAGQKSILSFGGGEWSSLDFFAGRLKQGIIKLLLRIPDHVVPCNESVAFTLSELGVDRERMTLISNALPDETGSRAAEPLPEQVEAFLASHGPVLVYVGALLPHYGLEDVLDALEKLSGEHERIGLVALVKRVGDEVFAAAIQKRLDRDALYDRVQLHESVPWAVAAMARVDVMIRATRIFEGDSRAIREAIAVGLPVVASDIGYRPDGVVTYGAQDVADLAVKIEVALGQSAPPQGVSSEGEESITRYEELFRKILPS